jgi:hypothetical protein
MIKGTSGLCLATAGLHTSRIEQMRIFFIVPAGTITDIGLLLQLSFITGITAVPLDGAHVQWPMRRAVGKRNRFGVMELWSIVRKGTWTPISQDPALQYSNTPVSQG